MSRLRWLVCAALAFGSTLALASSWEDFESYPLGSLHGQTGPGGVSWSKTSPFGVEDAYTAVPGHVSAKSGRWDVQDLSGLSVGDDMTASFAPLGPEIVVSAWTYSFLGVDPLFPGGRVAEFVVRDDPLGGVPVGLRWLPNGFLGDSFGNQSQVAYQNSQWVEIEIGVNYATSQYWLTYGGAPVLAGALPVASQVGSASALNIFLETISLDETPNPNDSLHVDGVRVIPEPATALLGLLALLMRRR
jgi:hypothetical protein